MKSKKFYYKEEAVLTVFVDRILLISSGAAWIPAAKYCCLTCRESLVIIECIYMTAICWGGGGGECIDYGLRSLIGKKYPA